jgi:hypothetical protein
MRLSLVSLVVGCAALSGCATPTSLGGDTYFSAQSNLVGDVTATAVKLMAQGDRFCTSKGKKFEFMTMSTTWSVPDVRFGEASIGFKCVDRSRVPVMHRDNGVIIDN